jgi:calcineurin-like phosphoesterase family protein
LRLAPAIILIACAAAHAEPRVVAIGDLHGDVAAARCALRRAGAIDERDRWVGGALVVVQTGDQLDRGDDEPEILTLLDRLSAEAAAAGGRVVVLNGNHELMNVAGDFRYVTPDGFADYGGEDGRRRAFAPGSPLARALAAHPIYAIVGDTLFVHGGVRRGKVADLESLDAEARAWMRGEKPEPPRALTDPEGPLWTRLYGEEGDARACREADAVLSALKLRRMVVAHTFQAGGANAICDGRVWRIDVGLGRAYGRHAQVLELRDGRARVLRGCEAR